MIASLAVFCGASRGGRPEYTEAAAQLGGLLADHGIRLVFGGSDCGTMRVLANAALDHGGAVTGVFPSNFRTEILNSRLTDVVTVDTMSERKDTMLALSDAVAALPGAYGTFDEYFHAVTQLRLGMHRKPCWLINVRSFYDPLLTFLRHAVDEGFLQSEHEAMTRIAADPDDLLAQILQEK